jgi:hypothetical protein
MLDAAIAAISMSLFLLIIVFLLSLYQTKAPRHAVWIRRWVRCGDPQLNIFLSLRSWRFFEIALSFTPPCGSRQACSHKIEFSFLNGNLIAPASRLRIFNHDTFPNGGGTNVWQFESRQRRGTIIPLPGDGSDLLPAGQPYASSPCAQHAA